MGAPFLLPSILPALRPPTRPPYRPLSSLPYSPPNAKTDLVAVQAAEAGLDHRGLDVAGTDRPLGKDDDEQAHELPRC